MFKKILLVVVVLTLITLTTGYLFRAELSMALIATQIKPEADFDPALVPAAPDYSKADAWAALPDKRAFLNFVPVMGFTGSSIKSAGPFMVSMYWLMTRHM